jgi:hypothetical protein
MRKRDWERVAALATIGSGVLQFIGLKGRRRLIAGVVLMAVAAVAVVGRMRALEDGEEL